MSQQLAPRSVDLPPQVDADNSQDPNLWKRVFNLRTLVSFAISALILVGIFTRLNINVGEIVEDIRQSNPWLLVAAFGVYYLGFPLRAVRWRLLLQNVGAEKDQLPGIPRLSEILLLSWFTNCLVPAKIGDVYRAYLLRQDAQVSFARTAGTVLAERVIDLLILFCLLLGSAFVIIQRLPNMNADATRYILIVGAVMAAILIAGLIVLRFAGGRLARFLPQRIEGMFQLFQHGILGSFRPRQFPLVAMLTVGIWLTEAGRLFFVTKALGGAFDLNIGLSVIIFAALANSLLTAVPATPGGLGVVEAGVIGILTVVGVDPRAAAAITVLDRTISYWSLIVVGGIIYIVNFGRRR